MRYRENSYNNWSDDSVRMILTTSPQARKMYYYVQETGYFKTFNRYYTERENLNSFLVVYTISGSGLLRYRGKEYKVLPGQAFFIHCMEYQYYQAADVPWEFLWVHFNGGVSLAYFNEYIKNRTPVIRVRDQEAMEKVLRNIIDTNCNRDFTTETITSMIITELLTELIISSHINTAVREIPPYIQEAVSYIEKNYMERITLDILSKRFAVNKFYLHRAFKQYIGLTPNDYTIHCRLNHAKELLKYSNLSVKEISFRVGIENVSHFINLFKKSEHKTPSVFKSEWNGKD